MEIWVVDDDAGLRVSLCRGLQRVRRELSVRTFEGAGAVLAALDSKLVPDVALVDLGLPDMSGVDLIAEVSRRLPKLPMIALTVRFDDMALFGALGRGAIGYLLKDSSAEQLASAAEEAVAGGSPLSPSIARRVIRQLQPDAESRATFGLTEREQQVLDQLCSGASYREAASRLDVAEGTVHSHAKRIYEKLGAANKAEAVRIAMDARLVAMRHG
jgi:DNA-binding NarL/FixJ family response regulator